MIRTASRQNSTCSGGFTPPSWASLISLRLVSDRCSWTRSKAISGCALGFLGNADLPIDSWVLTVVVHTTGNPELAFLSARSILHDLNPDLPPSFRTFADVYSASLASRRFSLTLVGVFSFAALLLALAGIYGVISYSVSQRTREIGVRMALGDTTREVLLMVLEQGAITGAIGIACGLAGSFAITRLLQSQLFEISPTDPLTLAGASVLLLIVSLAACAIPGRRATRIDPVVALRCE